jgi:hypothetical protein
MFAIFSGMHYQHGDSSYDFSDLLKSKHFFLRYLQGKAGLITRKAKRNTLGTESLHSVRV